MRWLTRHPIQCLTQRANSRFFIKHFSPLVPVMMIAITPSIAARAQEIPRPSIARQKVSEPPPADANIRVGQVRFSINAALNTEYVDNVYATSVDPIEDVILTPEVGIAAAWQLTTLNTLRFRTTIGYAKYLNNPRLDRQSLTLSPDSALSFKVYAGDVRIDFHDRFSLTSETSEEASLSGIASLPRFENTAGVSIVLDLNQVIWSLGYAHYNFVTLGSAVSGDGTQTTDLSRLDHSTDQLSTAVMLRLDSALLTGIEATAAYSTYPDEATTDFASFSIGPFVQFQLTRFTSIQASGGLKGYSTEDGEPVALTQLAFQEDGSLMSETVVVPGQPGGTDTGFYANVAITNRLNRYYSHRLDLGHEDQADALAGRTETNFVRYSSSLILGNLVSLSASLFVEDVQERTGGGVGATVASDYRRFGAGLGVVYRLSERTNVGLSYQFTKQESDLPAAAYEQNRISVRLGYRF